MNEKNDILQMLRDREDEFRLPLRKGGWEKLDADLSALMPEPELPGLRAKPVRYKLYRCRCFIVSDDIGCRFPP